MMILMIIKTKMRVMTKKAMKEKVMIKAMMKIMVRNKKCQLVSIMMKEIFKLL